ncbi:MAG: riboflavin synthase [Planctomycetes bacterium]|nr:riboflavin synthase [Planctomycetota bacterium]
MFTGLVAAIGTATAVQPGGDAMRIDVDLGDLAGPHRIGDSIALSGVCCTVIELRGNVAGFDLSPETLRRTWLGEAVVGSTFNLEPALRAGDALGGHMVQGHVDGTAVVTGAIDARYGGELRVRLPRQLMRYCVEKGSVTLDGVSLTIADLEADEITIAIIPHTAQQTTLGRCAVGDPLHVEVDVLAKYVEKMLDARGLGSR